MCTFISAEFFIGNVLIALHRQSIPSISIENLRCVARKFQDFCNDRGLDALITEFDGEAFEKVLYENQHLFELNPGNMLRVKPGIGLETLKRRFVGYLPLNILCALSLELPKMVAEVCVLTDNQPEAKKSA